MDLRFTQEEERYRARVREFLRDNLPQGWGAPGYELPKGRALVELLRHWQDKAHGRRTHFGGVELTPGSFWRVGCP
jgi:hypothetical protein